MSQVESEGLLQDLITDRRKSEAAELMPESRQALQPMAAEQGLRLLDLAQRSREPQRAVFPETLNLRVGDLVRTTTEYWILTQQHFSGEIVALEKVSPEQVAMVGSEYWAYLNSGAGPLSLRILEKLD